MSYSKDWWRRAIWFPRGAESSLYVATGKMGYFYQVVSWIADSQKLLPAEDVEPDESQVTGELL